MNHKNRQHSDFAPSSMERLSQCPGSWLACKEIGDYQDASIYADIGTLAHEVLDYVLKTAFEKEVPKLDLTDDKYTDEMLEHAEQACDAIRAEIMYFETEYADKYHGGLSQADIFVEETVYYSDEEFGTPDFRAEFLYKDGFRVRYIYDYKYGYDKVAVIGNKQLCTYALYANKDIKADFIKTVIHQPLIESWEEANYLSSDLSLYAALYEAIKKQCRQGWGFLAGDHCKHCAYKPKCKTYFSHNNVKHTLPTPKNANELPADTMWNVYKHRAQIKKFLSDLESYCFKEAMQGRLPDDLKLVQIKGRRSWSNQLTVEEIANKLTELGCATPTKIALKGIGEIEKALKGIVPEELVSKSSDSLRIVDADDKREAVDPTVNLIDVFK